jgi:hypothetical protein
MKRSWVTNFLLLVIAIALMVIAVRPYLAPEAAQASSVPYPFYIEPGTAMLRAPDGSRQVFGRMVVDMRTGKIWGFPTYTQDPYPTSATSSAPAVSKPFYLGRFEFEDAEK